MRMAAAAMTALSFVVASVSLALAEDAKTPSAIEAMSAPGPEQKGLANEVGSWDVTFTLWPKPGAAPMVTEKLVAERVTIGPFLQETLKPAAGSAAPDFTRIDYLSFDRIEGRWKYVSMDTRFPVSLMPAWSFGGADKDGAVTLQFEALAFPGFGPAVEGRLMRSDMTITHDGPDHEMKQQHFIMADGTGTQWLAVQYDYRRRH